MSYWVKGEPQMMSKRPRNSKLAPIAAGNESLSIKLNTAIDVIEILRAVLRAAKRAHELSTTSVA